MNFVQSNLISKNVEIAHIAARESKNNNRLAARQKHAD